MSACVTFHLAEVFLVIIAELSITADKFTEVSEIAVQYSAGH